MNSHSPCRPASLFVFSYDGRALTPTVEEIRLDDARLRQSWGDRLFRILLRAEAPPSAASWAMRITR